MTTPIVLASGSASRRTILQKACVPFSVEPARVDEDALKARFDGAASELAQYLADAKAVEVSSRRTGLVIGADQVLEFNDRAYDKARTLDEARQRLAMLSGAEHRLLGAMTLAEHGQVVWRHASVCVMTVRPLSAAFIDAYMAQAGDILLKGVGGYAYEGLGAQLFERVHGDFFAVLGLDLLPLLAELRRRKALPA